HGAQVRPRLAGAGLIADPATVVRVVAVLGGDARRVGKATARAAAAGGPVAGRAVAGACVRRRMAAAAAREEEHEAEHGEPHAAYHLKGRAISKYPGFGEIGRTRREVFVHPSVAHVRLPDTPG